MLRVRVGTETAVTKFTVRTWISQRGVSANDRLTHLDQGGLQVINHVWVTKVQG